MDTLAVKIPKDQKKKLGKIAEDGGYPNKSEFVREMIREEIKKRKKVRKKFLQEIKERKKDLEEGKIALEEMKTIDQIAEEQGLKK